MRIVIDMQDAQSESRSRGIARQTISFVQAIIRNRGEHEVMLALSGLFPDTIEAVRMAFDGLLPQKNIRVWYAPGPFMTEERVNAGPRQVVGLIREAFFASLRPDIIHTGSLLAGDQDGTVSSTGLFAGETPVVTVSFFDLAPLMSADGKLDALRIGQLRRAACCFVTSESARQTLSAHPDLQHVNIVDIPLAGESGTWLPDDSARRAIAAFEALHARRAPVPPTLPTPQKPRLAYVSPLPPERTGIADYSAELLPELARYYEIDVIVTQDGVSDPAVTSCCAIRTVEWFLRNAERYDRVLYHVGNSAFHQYMLELLKVVSGVVVLHDFFLSGLVAHMDSQNPEPGGWAWELYNAHGYKALQERFTGIDSAEVVWRYPCNFSVLQDARGVIVHSRNSMHLAGRWYGGEAATEWVEIPLLRAPANKIDKVQARANLEIGNDAFVVCAFGLLGPAKLNHRLLDAWLASGLAQQGNCRLVFVGEKHRGEYGRQLTRRIAEAKAGDRISITGWVDSETFRTYLAAADIGVQLRALSRGETSATALDSMNYGLATIANANGSMAELDPEAVWLLPDEFSDAELITALETLWNTPGQRSAMADRARRVIRERHAPAACAARYAAAIEKFQGPAAISTAALVRAIATVEGFAAGGAGLPALANAVAATLPLMQPAGRLFVDVSATCRNDQKTGIERVVRALVVAFFEAPPAGYRVEPVYLDQVAGRWCYRRASRYTLGLLGCPADALDDGIVEPESGDLLLGLDISGDMLVNADAAGLIRHWRDKGVEVYFMVHDLLPIRMPEVFPAGAGTSHDRWLRAVSNATGAICVSKAVADDLASWQVQARISHQNRRPFKIGWSHHGADVSGSAPSRGLPEDAATVLAQIARRPGFLMVGTVEPRKACLETIEAFNWLWREGAEVNLVIVGKEGWKGLPDDMRRDIPQTVECLETHPELNTRLFWLAGISDEYLEKIYAASSCLIAASYDEGFGLPLIEAAQHKLPIIARDIPVFREVAGDYANYFDANQPGALGVAVTGWLARSEGEANRQPMPCLSWKESAANLLKLILQGGRVDGSSDLPHSGMRYREEHLAIKNLYVDVSVVSKNDFRTGIQRAVRSLLQELIANPPAGYQVIPVCLEEKDGKWNFCPAIPTLLEYRKNARLAPAPSHNFAPAGGDIVLGLDLAGSYVVAAAGQGLYRNLMRLGVQVYYVVYDLLPVTQPRFFSPPDCEGHKKWLQSISDASGILCISKSVADDFLRWHESAMGKLPANLSVGHFHLGADIERSNPTAGVPEDAAKTLAAIEAGVSFLMVGTIEPRKGHLQVLEACEHLWEKGLDIRLVIVGNQGWMVDDLAARIRAHPELNHRLFWLAGISDEYLEKVYAAGTCLIAASYGEGFGLPLIEAARHQLPVIARDIPVFREVAGAHAYYFSAESPQQLAAALEDWLSLHAADRHPESAAMPWLTWAQSSRSLLAQMGLS